MTKQNDKENLVENVELIFSQVKPFIDLRLLTIIENVIPSCVENEKKFSYIGFVIN